MVVVDTKGLIEWGWPMVRTANDLFRSARNRANLEANRRIIYRPEPSELRDPAILDSVLGWCYRRTNTTIYLDEVFQVVANGIPLSLLDCVQRGREYGVEVWASTQRPSGIPLVLLTEASHYYVFHLSLREDRRRVEELCGVPAELPAQLTDHRFYYSNGQDDPSGPLRLEGVR